MKSMYSFMIFSYTVNAFLDFMNYSYDAILNSECLFAVYMNFSKAFDIVNHNIMLRKQQHIAVRG